MRDREFKKGEMIFLEGDTGNTMYQIKEGTVSIYAGYGDSEQKLMTELEEGRIFGEMAVIEECPRSATAVAKDDVKALEISADEVMDYFRTQPDMIMKIMKGLGKRLRELTEDYAEAGNAVREIGDSVDKEFGGALLEKILRFATEYKRQKAMRMISAEEERKLTPNAHNSGYSADVEAYDKGTIIFKEGEKGDCMYNVHFGSVGIYESYGTPNERLLTTLSAGRFFGELGMIDNVERSCTAVAMEDNTTVEIINASEISELFENDPDKIEMILEHLSYRLRKLTVDYMNFCRMIYRVNEARESGSISDDLKMEARSYVEKLLVIRSLKL